MEPNSKANVVCIRHRLPLNGKGCRKCVAGALWKRQAARLKKAIEAGRRWEA